MPFFLKKKSVIRGGGGKFFLWLEKKLKKERFSSASGGKKKSLKCANDKGGSLMQNVNTYRKLFNRQGGVKYAPLTGGFQQQGCQ